jgi:hypothetical protein
VSNEKAPVMYLPPMLLSAKTDGCGKVNILQFSLNKNKNLWK